MSDIRHYELPSGEGRVSGEAIDKSTRSIRRGSGHGASEKVVRVIGGDPFGARVTASTSLRAAAQAGVGQGRTTVEPGNAGGGKDPDFWRAFEEGEVKVIGKSLQTPTTPKTSERRRVPASQA